MSHRRAPQEASSISDYSHHNEEAAIVWLQEEGRHVADGPPSHDDDDWGWNDYDD